jgi:hypothetical protein
MGTSFSCPLLASHAALAREYFMTGYYPSGSRRGLDGFVPSGALLKAVLVHGAKKIEHIQLSDGGEEGTNTAVGDNHQGYGRAELDKSLSFSVNASLEGLTYFVIGAADSASEHYAELAGSDSPHVYTFTTVAKSDLSPIRVTLSYTVSKTLVL